MSNRIVRSKVCTIAAIMMLVHSWIGTNAEDLRYSRVSRKVIEGRLGKYAGNNKQRAATLKQMFTEAG